MDASQRRSQQEHCVNTDLYAACAPPENHNLNSTLATTTMPQTTPFSFHCMICFEEFDPELRYPVVLPCGHTYVCKACADRIDICMECREPLFTVTQRPQQQQNQQVGGASWSNARYGGRGGRTIADRYSYSPQPTPRTPPIKKRLPLPKNVVLLSLIEATELASEDARKDGGVSPKVDKENMNVSIEGYGEPVLLPTNSILDAEDEEEEKIKVGTSIAVGVAGTYAVAERNGLDIYPTRPPREDIAGPTGNDEDVDTLVRFFHLDHQKTEGAVDSGENPPHPRLSFGDRVQIVSLEDGWAKLARGYGYVQAGRSKLVKVGNSVDRACKLEAMLRNLSIRRKALRIEQSKVDNQFIGLMKQLQASLQNDEDLTVILADTFATPSTSAAATTTTTTTTTVPQEEDHQDEKKSSLPSDEEDDSDNDDLMPAVDSSVKYVRQESAADQPRFGCFSGPVFDEEETGGQPPDQMPFVPASASNATDARDSYTANLFPSASHPSPSAMRAGAQAWRDRHGRSAASGTDIDFRTGMSSHMGVLSSHAHSHEYLGGSTPTRSHDRSYRPKMSSHMGVTMKLPSLSGFLGLSLPSLRTSPREATTQDPVAPTTSM